MKGLRNYITYITIVLMVAFLLSPSFAPVFAGSPQTFYAHSEESDYPGTNNEMDQRTGEPNPATYNVTPSGTGFVQLQGRASSNGSYFTQGWPNSETITSGTWTFYTWLQMAEGTATYEVRVFKNADAGAQFTSSTASIPSSWTEVSTTGSNPGISMTAGDRLRFEYWANVSALPSQTKYPTANGDGAGWTIGGSSPASSIWDSVNDNPPHDSDVTFIYSATSSNQRQLFTSSISIPTNATVTNVSVYYYSKDHSSGTNKSNAQIKVNGGYYNDPSLDNPGTGYPSSPGFGYTWSTNPASTVAWTPGDINGTSSYPLQQFGVFCTDANPAVRVTSVYLVVNYRVPISIRVDDLSGENTGTRVDTTVGQLVPALGYYLITLVVVFFLLVAIRRKVLVLGRGGAA